MRRIRSTAYHTTRISRLRTRRRTTTSGRAHLIRHRIRYRVVSRLDVGLRSVQSTLDMRLDSLLGGRKNVLGSFYGSACSRLKRRDDGSASGRVAIGVSCGSGGSRYR